MKTHEAIRKRLVNAENEFTIAQKLSHEMAPKAIEELIASGLTLRQVARRIGRSPTYVSHVRTGVTKCSPRTYFELSFLLSKIEKGEGMSEMTWHPASEPPDNMRQVMLRFDPEGNRDRQGFYWHDFGVYARSETNARRLKFVHPTHWRELTEEER